MLKCRFSSEDNRSNCLQPSVVLVSESLLSPSPVQSISLVFVMLLSHCCKPEFLLSNRMLQNPKNPKQTTIKKVPQFPQIFCTDFLTILFVGFSHLVENFFSCMSGIDFYLLVQDNCLTKQVFFGLYFPSVIGTL